MEHREMENRELAGDRHSVGYEPRLEFRWEAGDESGEFWDREEEFLEDYYSLFRVMEQVHPEHSDSLFPGMRLYLDNWETGRIEPGVRSLEWLLGCCWGFSPDELYLNLASPDDWTHDVEWSFYVNLCQDLSNHIQFVKPLQLLLKPEPLSEADHEIWLQRLRLPYEWRYDTLFYDPREWGLGFCVPDYTD
jgi:hypothetical protein